MATTGEEFADVALRQAVDAAPDGFVVADSDGTIVFANPTVATMFGYAPEELLGSPVELLLPDDLRDSHVGHRHGYSGAPRTRPMGSGLDLHGRRKSGETFPVEIGLSPVATPDANYVIAIVRDVTERRRAAEELMRAQEQLALVDDRERIARDLHDTVIQRLFAVGLSLQGALTRATAPELVERLEVAIDEIDGTIRDIRTAIFALATRRTPTAGTRDDVLAVAREAARALGFEPHVTFDGLVDSAMTAEVRDQVIPTLREALSNVVKHAHANRVVVSLSVAEDEVRLDVTDDGIGVIGDETGGRGLGNMAERAAALGGRCEVRAVNGGGTTVAWRVPLHV